VCEAALRLTAAYVSEREQFGSKIGTFQAVAQRIADAYIDTEGIRLTAIQAAWRLSEELSADDEVHIAKFWASFGGDRVVHAAQHLHGGVGVDLDYPIHRYFRWSKVIELTLGTATEHLRLLGQRIAAAP
jgi:alkylation response protein AidB-like acyl-CoA dehydrogenase